MKKITGYQVPCVLKKSFSCPLPFDLEILTVMVVHGQPVLYGLTDPEVEEKRPRTFRIFGNEEAIVETAGIYIGSFTINGKVPLHMFELDAAPPALKLLRP